MKKLEILVVEDGKSQREMLKNYLEREGHLVREAENGEQALRQVGAGHFDLMLLDYRMPGMDGMQVLREVRKINPEMDIVIITAYGTIESAVEAMKAGALDYITKPIEFEELQHLVGRVAERRTLIRENEILRQELRGRGITADNIIFRSRKMEELLNLAGRVATSRANVLIRGESGTGKELLARLIHNLSPRLKKPMIPVNCGALHENLLESELFGHERGAFTGAHSRKIGRVEEADGGTLFLDEVGDIPLSIQVKILRFIQEREFQRLGGNQILRADVRIVAATNRNLEVLVKDGLFREDLFYRLNVIMLNIPPLRERKEDLPVLIEHFIGRFVRENRRDRMNISSEASDMLMKYDYPGNVRELENILERAVVIARDDVISIKDLPFHFAADEGRSAPAGTEETLLRCSVEELERKLLTEALEKANHNQSRAAELLGISERMLRYKMKKYALPKADDSVRKT